MATAEAATNYIYRTRALRLEMCGGMFSGKLPCDQTCEHIR